MHAGLYLFIIILTDKRASESRQMDSDLISYENWLDEIATRNQINVISRRRDERYRRLIASLFFFAVWKTIAYIYN